MKKVIMVGYAWSKNEVNWDDDAEYWIMNDMYDICPKFDRLFDLHLDKYIKNRVTRNSKINHYEYLKTIDKPVYMQEVYPEIPASVKYPLEIMIANYFNGNAMGDKIFMTCTVTFMLALAIYEGFTDIEIYGIDESVDDEYSKEMPGVLYWLGVAAGKGINIKISEHSPLMKGYFVYGYEEEKKKKINTFFEKETQRINEIKENAVKNQEYFMAEENKCIGASTILTHISKLMNDI